MRTLDRNKITIYLAKRDFDNPKPPQFAEVVELEVNFDVANSRADILAFGENYLNVRKSNIDNDIRDVDGNIVTFHETDRVYLTEPDSYDKLANNADYKVTSVQPSINNTAIIYEKLSGV